MSPKFSPDQRAELIARVIRGESVSNVCNEAGISRVVFYRWIKRYKDKGIKGLTPIKAGRPNKEKKHKVVDEYTELSPNARQMMLQEVIDQKQAVTDVARKYGVSRTTVYKWINRYKKASSELKDQVLVSKKPKIDRYFRQTPEKYEEAVLSFVSTHPECGIRKIVASLPTIGEKPIVGHHGVQNILKRNNLSTYEERLEYARSKVTPVTKSIEGVLGWVTKFFGLAPEFRARTIRFLGVFALTTFFTVVVFGLSGLVVRSFSAATGASPIGLFFASVALFMGSVFFLYSFKYYLTIVLVLSFSQKEGMYLNGKNGSKGIKGNILDWILGNNTKDENEKGTLFSGMEPDLEGVKLERKPFVSVHIPFYNEKNVVERSIEAASNFDYPEYEIILCDDSTDETSTIIKEYQKKCLLKGESLGEKKGDGWTLTWVEVKPGVTLKHLYRISRQGFKGGALQLAKKLSDPRTEFISIFDADFVPYQDSLELFLKYFKVQNSMSEEYKTSKVAVVQGYQWHVLNKSENWITRGVRCEYSGSYVIERPGTEIYGGLKQISGSVYMIRKDVLDELGWGISITEDFELTLKLYEKGYKVVYSPYIQAPAECVSTTKRLIRQRMRWAEGHSQNIRKMFKRLIFNPKLSFSEKLEFLYLSPYYLQAFFFLTGTISWFISETIFPAKLPFWTSLWGWSLVLTNMFSLPLMNTVGLFLEESEERDYLGLASFMALSYILVPFQAYAALKGFLENEEGPWFRTPKTGKITDVFTRGQFYRFITGIIPGLKGSSYNLERAYNQNKYFSLATANNTFSTFSIVPKKKKWVGKLAISILLIISIISYSFSKNVPVVHASNWSNLYIHEDNSVCSTNDSMNTSIGSSPASITYNTDSQSYYWYSDSLPTGLGDGNMGSGNRTFTMYGAWTGGTTGDSLTMVAAISLVDASSCGSESTEDVSGSISFNKVSSFPASFTITLSNNANTVITSSSPKRIRLRISSTAKSKSGAVRMDYDSATNTTNLNVTGLTVPETVIFFIVLAPFIPFLVDMFLKNDKKAFSFNK